MKRRINLFGGPGGGKSTLAARIFTFLKLHRADIELVQERFKRYVYDGRTVRPWDYVHTFGKQFDAEFHILQAGVQRIVTDSPLLLQCVYARHQGCPVHRELTTISHRFDEDFPALNIFVRRKFSFQEAGRFGDEEQAIEMDKLVEETLDGQDIPYTSIRPGYQCDINYLFRLLEN